MQQAVDGLVASLEKARFQGGEPVLDPTAQGMGTPDVGGRFVESTEECECGMGEGTAETSEMPLGWFTGLGFEFGRVRLADVGCDILEERGERPGMEEFDGIQWGEWWRAGLGPVPGRWA